MSKNGKDNLPKEVEKKAQKKIFHINKIVLVNFLNLILFLFLGYQIYLFSKENATKASQLLENGRKVNLDIKSKTVELLELSNNELPEALKIREDNNIGTNEESEDLDPDNVNKSKVDNPLKKDESKDYNIANLAIIVTELGLKSDNYDSAKTLPTEVSFAFSPYTDSINRKILETQKEGREALINLVFEPSNYPLEDSGPLTIQSHFEQTQNILRFQETIRDKEEVIGYLTNTDEIITHNLDNVAPILLRIKEQGRFFLFYKQPVNSFLEQEAKPLAVDIGIVDYLIDENPDEEKILKKLDLVKKELLEERKKLVIAIKPNKVSINILKNWLETNINDSIRIAPISYFITDN